MIQQNFQMTLRVVFFKPNPAKTRQNLILDLMPKE